MDEEQSIGSKGPSHKNGAYLVWEDLKVVPANYYCRYRKKPLLQGLTGYAVPGCVMAILGPSGSGKTTLLNSLAGRLHNNMVVTGSIRLNGHHKRMLQYGAVAYVTQETTFLTMLTVRETITYSSYLRLPSEATEEEVKDLVGKTIEQMGLCDCSDQFIARISNGEKKRLSIALELLTRPSLLFVDEPTTGLDSAAALFVMLALRRIAEDGKTVITSIHQPNGDIFSLFDDLCLLSEGEMVYFGYAKEATEFFQQAGFPCPIRQNPSDHFLRCLNTDFDKVVEQLKGSRRFIKFMNSLSTSVKNIQHIHEFDHTSEQYYSLGMETTISRKRSRIIDHYHKSVYPTFVRKRIIEISKMEVYSCFMEDTWNGNASQASLWKQFVTLIKRSMLKARRDFGYYWLRIIILTITSFCIGTLSFDVGTSYESIQLRSAIYGFVFGFMTIMSIVWFSYFVEEMKVFSRERLNGHYGAFVFVSSSLASSLPLLFVLSLCSSSVLYYMVKLHPGFSHFCFFAVNLFVCLAVVESIMMIVASIVPNFLMGIITAVGVMIIMMLAAGVAQPLTHHTKPTWCILISYISYISWAIEGQYKNDMLGLQFDSMRSDGSKLSGESIVENILRVKNYQSKWFDLMTVFALLISFRFIFLLIIKCKEYASVLIRMFHSKMGRSL